ncbi:nucleotidyltransferase family protein [Sphingobacterium rhinopitheci]|uniref:nucleotidyltransferase family protein n=1 Tax=Sphingobacterium rhinopitheci TaxID=2781960 RepID=UPI001F5205EE|nr:nucleotidyltransferase family protein [Sphingobacterium rhinopitheci]MCI0920747.1 nucleotidyltransferase family protein [Sphingobacterium rhinopitheci]
MLDSNVVTAFFTLLRSGLWGTPVDNLMCFPLTDTEWNLLYNIAVAQTVEGIVYDGIQNLPQDNLPSRIILLTWVVKVNRIEITNKKMNNCIEEQVLFFNSLNVKPILLKGQGVASYYVEPKHRVCGDIDWYFDNENDSKLVEEALSNQNILISKPTIDSSNYYWKQCEVEHHTKLFDVFNPFARYRLKNVENDFLKNRGKVDSYYILPPNINILQVNLHILKHLLSFGIGLRQFCDSAVLYAKLETKYDKQWLHKIYEDIGIIKWIHVLHHLLVNYLGLPEKSLPFAIKPYTTSKWMAEEILSTGNFGFFDENFNTKNSDNLIIRKNKSKKLLYSFRTYFLLAPYEALSFPIVHFVERFKALRIG